MCRGEGNQRQGGKEIKSHATIYTPEIVYRYNILGLKKTHTVQYWFIAQYLRCGFQLRTRYICQSFFWSTGLWVRPSVMHESESVNRRISVFALRCEGRGGEKLLGDERDWFRS